MAFLNDDSKDEGIFSEINITPMVDVMLVLLIIFMVTAPFMMDTIGVNLPKGKGEASNADNNPLTISLDKDANIFVAEKKLNLEELANFLKASPRIKDGEEVYIEADGDCHHKDLVAVMSKAHEAGVQKINIMMEK